MDPLVTELAAAVRKWDDLGWPRPQAMVVSGSGLATDLGQRLCEPCSWADFLPFPARGIAGHSLEIELLEPVAGRPILYSRGRIHAYQGFTAAQVVFPVRFAALLGARVLVLTNSSGGLQTHQRSGDLLLLDDHLNLTGMNPLYGELPPAWGPQFPDMATAYDPALRALFRQAAADLGIALAEGVYCGLLGPSYETPAEVRMLRGLGGDVVGMSTVLEVIAGHHMGLRCAGLSLIANPGAGVTDEKLTHADVLAQGREAASKISRLLSQVLSHPDLLAGKEE